MTPKVYNKSKLEEKVSGLESLDIPYVILKIGDIEVPETKEIIALSMLAYQEHLVTESVVITKKGHYVVYSDTFNDVKNLPYIFPLEVTEEGQVLQTVNINKIYNSLKDKLTWLRGF